MEGASRRFAHLPAPFFDGKESVRSIGPKVIAPRNHSPILSDVVADQWQYPSNIAEMVRDECEMIEVIDLTHPKKAQLILDDLMSDSR